MSKLLRKILSAAVFPAALMIVSKLAGIALVNTVFGLDWGIQSNTGSIFSVQVIYADAETAIMSNSYSTLFMIAIMTLGVGILLFQSHFLNTSNQNPKVLIKLIQFDFVMWLSETSVIFPKIAVWLAFLWIASIISIAQSIQGTTYAWISVFGFVVAVIATWLGARDFEKEIRTILPENGKLNVG